MDAGTLLATAESAARAGAEVLLRYFRDRTFQVREKGAFDFVTSADAESEAAILAVIRAAFPDHAVLAEEGGASSGEAGYQWLVDPLDGTTNFLQGLPLYAVSVACRHRDEGLLAGVVLEPERGHAFAAARGAGARWNGRPMHASRRASLDGAFVATGYPFRARAALDLYLRVFRAVFLRAGAIRRCGAAALDLAYTAAGVYDGFFEFRLSAWDIAAGALLIQEAGGAVSDLDGGDRYLSSGNLVAGGASVWRDLREVVASEADEAALDAADPR